LGTSNYGFSSFPAGFLAGGGAFAGVLPVFLASSSLNFSSSFNFASSFAKASSSSFAYLASVSFRKISSTCAF
jgi:hypothetical protein